MKSKVVVVALIEKDGRYLLGKKAKDVGPYPNKWLILGGGVNLQSETLEEALKRELREEGNIEVIKIEPVNFDEDYKLDKHGQMTHYIFLQFRAKHLSGDPRPGSDIESLQWFTKEELTELTLPEVSVKLLKVLKLL